MQVGPTERPVCDCWTGEPQGRETGSHNRHNTRTPEDLSKAERHGPGNKHGAANQKSKVKVANRRLKALIEKQLTTLQQNCRPSPLGSPACQLNESQSTAAGSCCGKFQQREAPRNDTSVFRQSSATGRMCGIADQTHKAEPPVRSQSPSRRQTRAGVLTANKNNLREYVPRRAARYANVSRAPLVPVECRAQHARLQGRPASCSLPRHTVEEGLGDHSNSAPATYARVSPAMCDHGTSGAAYSCLRPSSPRFLSFRRSPEVASSFGSKSSLSDPAVSLDSCIVSQLGLSSATRHSDCQNSRDVQRSHAKGRLPPLPPRVRRARRPESPACDCHVTAHSQTRKSDSGIPVMHARCSAESPARLPTTVYTRARQRPTGKERLVVEKCRNCPDDSCSDSSDSGGSDNGCGHCVSLAQRRKSHLSNRRKERDCAGIDPHPCSWCRPPLYGEHRAPAALRRSSGDVSRKTKALEDAERRVEERLLILDVNQMVLEQQSERRKQLHQHKLMTLLEQRRRPEPASALAYVPAAQESSRIAGPCDMRPAKGCDASLEHSVNSFSDEKSLTDPVVSLSTAPTRAGTNGTLDKNTHDQSTEFVRTEPVPPVGVDEKTGQDDRNACSCLSKSSRAAGARSSRTRWRQSQKPLKLRARANFSAAELPVSRNTAPAHPSVA